MLDNPFTRVVGGIIVGTILISVLIVLMPVYVMPLALTQAIDWAFTTLWGFDFMIPVITMMTCFGLVILTDVIFASIKLVLFFKKHLTKS